MAMLVTSLLNKSPLRQHNVLVTVRKLLTLNFQTTNWRLLGISPSYPHFFRQITRGYSNGNPSPIPQAISEKNLLGRYCTALALMCLEAQRCQTNGDTSPTEMKIFNQQKQGYLPNGNEDITITIWR